LPPEQPTNRYHLALAEAAGLPTRLVWRLIIDKIVNNIQG
jgi:hypothetical protein